MAIKQLGKKGIFLTFISIALIAALLIIFTPSDINLKKDISVVKTRVSKVDEYVFDLENVYLENTLNAIGRRTIIALIEYMEAKTIEDGTNPVFLTDFENDFSQVLLDGTIGDPPIPIDDFIDPDIMTGKTYKDYLYANDALSIKKAAEKTLNVQTEFEPITTPDIRVSQTSPWFVDVEADINITVSTVEGTASWTRNVTIKTRIPIENFDDPYILVNTVLPPGTTFVNKIRKTGTKFDEWDALKVKDFIHGGNYTHFTNSNAPTFLMRFTNDFTDTAQKQCCGIESLLNSLLSSIDINKFVSYVDYLYWSDVEDCAMPPRTLFEVDEIFLPPPAPPIPFFKLDSEHLAKYQLTATSQVCPPET